MQSLSRAKPFASTAENICLDGEVLKDNNGRRKNSYMRPDTDRRSSEDRRSHKKMPETQFVDSEGVKVTRDRRRAPDRRINNINVEWHEDEEDNSA